MCLRLQKNENSWLDGNVIWGDTLGKWFHRGPLALLRLKSLNSHLWWMYFLPFPIIRPSCQHTVLRGVLLLQASMQTAWSVYWEHFPFELCKNGWTEMQFVILMTVDPKNHVARRNAPNYFAWSCDNNWQKMTREISYKNERSHYSNTNNNKKSQSNLGRGHDAIISPLVTKGCQTFAPQNYATLWTNRQT